MLDEGRVYGIAGARGGSVVRRGDRWGEGTLSDVGALSDAALLDAGIAGARERC